MKKHYLLDSEFQKNNENSLAAAVIVAADFHHPLEYKKEIEKELRSKKIQGNVIIDMLLANGSKKNRFFSIKFDGKHFCSNHEKLKEPKETIIYSQYSARILKEKYNEVNTNLLTTAMKFAVKKGLPIK
ncbi:MAG: type II toxin-antitoxin system RnlB family antitoxin [Pseudomonadota bacterium]